MLMAGEALFTYIGRGNKEGESLKRAMIEDGFDKATLPCIYLLKFEEGTKSAKFGCGKGKSNVDDLAQFLKDYREGKVVPKWTLEH